MTLPELDVLAEEAVLDRVMVGRERELIRLDARLSEARAGRGAVLVISGPPGIGKSLLLEAVVQRARHAGIAVARGRAWESDGASPYWPWVEALSTVDRRAAALLDAPPTPANGRPTQTADVRFATLRRVVDRLAAGVDEPWLIALEDMHAADAGSLLLTRLLIDRLSALPVLVIVAATAWSATDGPPALRSIAADGRVIALDGLSEPAVARILEHRLGRRPSLAFVRRVHTLTEGNPLFVEELARAPTSAGAATVPVRIAEAVAGRLQALPAEVSGLLAAAAVAGGDVDCALLCQLTDRDEGDVELGLRCAIEAGVLERQTGARVRFAHGLFAHALADSLDPPTRRRLHLRMACRYESGPWAPATASALAHHYRQAVPAADPKLAMQASQRAAQMALDRLAYEQAAAHAEAALALDATSAERLGLLLVVGESNQAAGAPERARAALREAAELARAHGDGDALARVALALGGGPEAWTRRQPDPELVTLLREAVAAVDGGLRARLLACLAEQVALESSVTDGGALAREAIDAAARTDEPAAEARARHAELLATLEHSDPDRRSRSAGQLRAAAARAGDPEALHRAHLWQLNSGLEQGRRDVVEGARRDLVANAERSGWPHLLWGAATAEAMVSLLDGRLQDTERELERAQTAAAGVVAAAPMMQGIQLLALRREQDRLGELEPAARRLAAAQPASLSWRCAWIATLCERDEIDRARSELRLVDDGVELGTEWIAVTLMLAELCTRLGDRVRGERLYHRLAPHAGEVAVVSFTVLCRGAVDRYLGQLAGLLDRLDDAERHFDAAQTLHARLGSATWTARTELDRALLCERVGDRAGACRAAEAAVALADDRGLVSIARAARAVVDRDAGSRLPLRARAERPRAAAERARTAAERLRFVREGELWAIGDPASPSRLPASRGLEHLARLLAHPGQEVLAAELAGAVAAGSQPVLDAAAKSAYRTRLRELDAALDAAERFGDEERASQARAELQALTAELGRAVGLRGRDRRLSGSSERARSSVTKAIRGAIRRLATVDPGLADHLDRAVRTGTFCSYVPDARHPIEWEVTM